MPVHGGDVEPALERCETDRYLFEAVGQHRRDLVARLQPERPQAVHDLIGERVELTEGHLLMIGINDGEMLGIGFGDLPETQDVGVGHGRDGGRPDAAAPIEWVSQRVRPQPSGDGLALAVLRGVPRIGGQDLDQDLDGPVNVGLF